jgi:hypothetical protein
MNLNTILQNLPALFGALLVAILFLQSGLDKVFDFKGNLAWLTGHFSKTFLRGMVLPMLASITVMELATGLLSAVALVAFFVTGGSVALIFYAAALGALSITALFFGQRVAKDYPGAAVLVPYFILLILLMVLTNPRPYGTVY